jgi:hypothetical protein
MPILPVLSTTMYQSTLPLRSGEQKLTFTSLASHQELFNRTTEPNHFQDPVSIDR